VTINWCQVQENYFSSYSPVALASNTGLDSLHSVCTDVQLQPFGILTAEKPFSFFFYSLLYCGLETETNQMFQTPDDEDIYLLVLKLHSCHIPGNIIWPLQRHLAAYIAFSSFCI